MFIHCQTGSLVTLDRPLAFVTCCAQLSANGGSSKTSARALLGLVTLYARGLFIIIYLLLPSTQQDIGGQTLHVINPFNYNGICKLFVPQCPFQLQTVARFGLLPLNSKKEEVKTISPTDIFQC